MTSDYLHQLTHLRTDTNCTRWTEATAHRAPHKPLLLLSILDRAAQGQIDSPFIEPSIDLIERFARYWEELRAAILNTYFAAGVRQNLLREAVENQEAFEYSQRLLQAAEAAMPFGQPDKPQQIRDQGFRKAIMNLYSHRCALCGIRMISPEGHMIKTDDTTIPCHLRRVFLSLSPSLSIMDGGGGGTAWSLPICSMSHRRAFGNMCPNSSTCCTTFRI